MEKKMVAGDQGVGAPGTQPERVSWKGGLRQVSQIQISARFVSTRCQEGGYVSILCATS